MERYQVNIAYDGTNFQGFQKQGKVRTVQSEIENSLREAGWQGRSILFAGRTDTGVHARGQVIAFDLEWQHGPAALLRVLNHNLPKDVSALSVKVAETNFQPRFDAIAREYRYSLFTSRQRDPLREYSAWRVWPAVELPLLTQAADLLIGIHDFKAFGSPTSENGSTIRQIFEAEWKQLNDEFSFKVVANAFLYRMVRRMVYLQVRVGQGKLSLEDLKNLLEVPNPAAPGLAKPQGLVLESVYYPVDGRYLNGIRRPGK